MNAVQVGIESRGRVAQPVYKRGVAAERLLCIDVHMNRWLLGAGIVLILAAVAWPWISRVPLGRLPGDLHVHRDGFDFYLPLGTSVLISILLSLLIWLLRR